MKNTQKRDESARKLFNFNEIATIDDIKKAISSKSTMTVYRTLSRIGYLTSYSHRGRFYTLSEIPGFNELGLWTYQTVMFSRYGNLLETTAAIVQNADEGFTASELESVLQVDVKHALLKLFRRKKISRSKLEGNFVYMSAESGQCRYQVQMRNICFSHRNVAKTLDVKLLPDELRAGIILFFSLLDEKQRRLFAGLEAAKLGHGGDKKIAELFGLDPHTVSKGRQELFKGAIDRSSVRTSGGGRKRVEKKHLK